MFVSQNQTYTLLKSCVQDLKLITEKKIARYTYYYKNDFIHELICYIV